MSSWGIDTSLNPLISSDQELHLKEAFMHILTELIMVFFPPEKEQMVERSYQISQKRTLKLQPPALGCC